MSNRIFIAVFSLCIILASVIGAAEQAVGVSPGAVERVTEIEGRCPTFFWGGEPGAPAFEVVVYRIPEGPQASDTMNIDLGTCEEALYARVPGGSSGSLPRPREEKSRRRSAC